MTLRVISSPPLMDSAHLPWHPQTARGTRGASSHYARPCACWLPSAQLCLNPPRLPRLCLQALPSSSPLGSMDQAFLVLIPHSPRGFRLCNRSAGFPEQLQHAACRGCEVCLGGEYRLRESGGGREQRPPVCAQSKSRLSSLENQGRLLGGGRWSRGSGAHLVPKKGYFNGTERWEVGTWTCVISSDFERATSPL